MQFFTNSEKLEELLKKKVDIVSADRSSKIVQPFADKDKVLVFER